MDVRWLVKLASGGGLDTRESSVEGIVPTVEQMVRAMGYRVAMPGVTTVGQALAAQRGQAVVGLTLGKPIYDRWWLYHRMDLQLGHVLAWGAQAVSMSWWTQIWPTGARFHVRSKPGFFGSAASRPSYSVELEPSDRRLRRRFYVHGIESSPSLRVVEDDRLSAVLLAAPYADLLVRDDYVCFADFEVRLLRGLDGLPKPTSYEDPEMHRTLAELAPRYVTTNARATAVIGGAIQALWATQFTRQYGAHARGARLHAR